MFAKVAVYDNHYSMALQVGYVKNTADGYMLETFDQYLTPIYSEKNSTSYVVYELTDYVDDIKKNAVNANVNGYKNEVKEQYATNGNTVTAYISVNEELKHNPTFTFYTNGKEVRLPEVCG